MCFQGPDAKKIWSIEAPETPSVEISEKNTKQMKYNANFLCCNAKVQL